MQYLSNWTQSVINSGQGSDNLAKRPVPVAMLYDNTTIEGSWIAVQNMTEISKKHSPSNYNRTVINITMAMPHAGVFEAMRNPINGIMQPQDLEVRSPNQATGFVANSGVGSWPILCQSICPFSSNQRPLCQHAKGRACTDRLF